MFKREKEESHDWSVVNSKGWRDMRPERQPEAINAEPVGCGKYFRFFSVVLGSLEVGKWCALIYALELSL